MFYWSRHLEQQFWNDKQDKSDIALLVFWMEVSVYVVDSNVYSSLVSDIHAPNNIRGLWTIVKWIRQKLSQSAQTRNVITCSARTPEDNMITCVHLRQRLIEEISHHQYCETKTNVQRTRQVVDQNRRPDCFYVNYLIHMFLSNK